MRFTITRAGSGFAGSVSHFASAVRRPVDSNPAGGTIFAGAGIEQRQESRLHFVLRRIVHADAENVRGGRGPPQVGQPDAFRKLTRIEIAELRQLRSSARRRPSSARPSAASPRRRRTCSRYGLALAHICVS